MPPKKTLKIRGGQVSSLGALRKSVKRSTSGGAIQRIPKAAPLTVRFMDEPDRWFEFFEHYDPAAKKGSICVGDGCPACEDEIRVSKRFLANAVDQDRSVVIALAMPTSLVNTLLKKYDKFGTLLDRDYELAREGDGMDTEYDATPEGKTKFSPERYEPLDLGAILESEAAGSDDEEEEDDDADDEFLKPPKKAAKKVAPRRAPHSSDDDEDEDEAPTRRRLAKKLPAKKIAPKKMIRRR